MVVRTGQTGAYALRKPPLEAAKLANDNINESRQGEQDTEHDGRSEERALKTSTGMEPGGEIVSSKRSAKSRARALQNHRHDDECGEDDLHVGKYLREESHVDERYHSKNGYANGLSGL